MNWDRAFQLLHIADLSRQWPKLAKLHDAALAELEKIAQGDGPKVIPNRPTPEAEPEERKW